jgi:alpha-glucosidase
MLRPASIALALLTILPTAGFGQTFGASSIGSPDGNLTVEFKLTADGAPVYLVRQAGKVVLSESRLGLVRDDEDFTKRLVPDRGSTEEKVADRYEILTAKRRFNTYEANRRVFHLKTATGKKLDVIFQVSNEGVAFRYLFPETSSEVRTLKEEVSSFHFQPNTKAWLQPMSVAKTGWADTNISYEEHYQQEIPVGTPSTLGAGWVYPALFRSGDQWLLVSESALDRGYCGTRLRHESPEGEYTVGFADPRETMNGLPVNPSSTLPWLTPWRMVVIGSLKTVAESTLGIDLAPPAVSAPTAFKPGKVAWSWPLLGDKSANYDTQKQFIDYAADMGWPYCLIDAFWDKQIGYEKTKELADYARGKNVELLLWYNSNGNWNKAHQTPKNRLLTKESRREEFTRLKEMGIRGIKADFFGGDGQPVIDFYHDLLVESAPYGLLMNFHGTTLPRGWQRTYPHLMTAEAIRGFEFITFAQADADKASNHCAMLPFTRNVFDPMDFTPVCLDRITNKVKRRTTSAFELALSVVFTSGLQHYVEIPAGMAKMPDYVKDFLRHVPAIWDDSKFIDGYPGKYAVLARKGEGRWHVAGINGEASEKTLTLDLGSVPGASTGLLITDGEAGALFTQTPVTLGSDRKLTVTIKPHGGFVLVLDSSARK